MASAEEVDVIVARLLVHVKRRSDDVDGRARATTAEDEVAGYLRENALEATTSAPCPPWLIGRASSW